MKTQGKDGDKSIKPDANKEMQEEMVGILTAISIVSKRLASRLLKNMERKETSSYQSDEMDEMTDLCVEYCLGLIEKAKENCQDLQVLIEQNINNEEASQCSLRK